MCLHTLVVSPHALVRTALLSMLDREPGVVPWEAGASPDAANSTPDVVLVESGRLDHAAIRSIRDLKARYVSAQVLVLTSSSADEAMREALDAGVSGFLLESASRADLMNAMHTVTCGGLFVGHDLLRSWLQRESPPPLDPPAHGDPLTPREVEVLRLVVDGYTNPSIAERLCICVRTVEFHRRNIREKLHIRSRAEMVRYAMSHGIVAHA